MSIEAPLKLIWGSAWAHATSHETSWRNEKGVPQGVQWNSAERALRAESIVHVGKPAYSYSRCTRTCKLDRHVLAFVETDKPLLKVIASGKWSLNS